MATALDLPQDSRYKDTPIYEGTRGPEFSLMEPPEEAIQEDRDYRTHRVRRAEVGFLDVVAGRHYGPGYEEMHWFIQLANGMIDAETEMQTEQELRIPPRALVVQFRTRGTNLAD